jgi:hypothetical protein
MAFIIASACDGKQIGPRSRAFAADRLASLRHQFNGPSPGRGMIDYPGNAIEDVPKGYAAILKGEIMGKQSVGPLSPLGRLAGQFLIDHSDERKDGYPGWGVPAAWDAYGDGSINPRHTKYAIANAVVIDALLDWVESDASAPRAQIMALAREALRPYTDPAMLSPAGLLPYSLEEPDRRYDTFNPAAYLAGVMQRFAAMNDNPTFNAALRRAADSTINALLRHKRLTAKGAWYWYYSVSETNPNDLAHAGYIMHGLRLYTKNHGALAARIDLPAVERHLADFLDPRTGALNAWPKFREVGNNPARAYDLGMGLYLVCTRADRPLQEAYLRSVDAYREIAGGYLKYPPKQGQKDERIKEYEAYVFMGLAACARQGRS